jgi:hypothetical protein
VPWRRAPSVLRRGPVNGPGGYSPRDNVYVTGIYFTGKRLRLCPPIWACPDEAASARRFDLEELRIGTEATARNKDRRCSSSDLRRTKSAGAARIDRCFST